MIHNTSTEIETIGILVYFLLLFYTCIWNVFQNWKHIILAVWISSSFVNYFSKMRFLKKLFIKCIFIIYLIISYHGTFWFLMYISLIICEAEYFPHLSICHSAYMYFFVNLSVHVSYLYLNWVIFFFLLVCKNFLYVKEIKPLS